jgi:hypothetical protein
MTLSQSPWQPPSQPPLEHAFFKALHGESRGGCGIYKEIVVCKKPIVPRILAEVLVGISSVTTLAQHRKDYFVVVRFHAVTLAQYI